MNLTAIGVENPFFEAVAERYRPQMELTIVGGKLTEADGWGNVARHCLVQAAACEVLAELLGLTLDDTRTLAKVAACHDWKKRLDRKPGDFTPEEKQYAEHLLVTASPDETLMNALGPWFIPRVVGGQATFLQLVQFYVDDIAMGGRLVAFDQRIDEVSARNPDPEPAVREALGRPYWEVEREVGHRVEAMLFAILKARCVLPELSSPTEIPAAISAGIIARGGVELS